MWIVTVLCRYKRQDETTDIIAAKQSILGMLQYVKGLRGQYRLEKLLNIFKEKKVRLSPTHIGDQSINRRMSP